MNSLSLFELLVGPASGIQHLAHACAQQASARATHIRRCAVQSKLARC